MKTELIVGVSNHPTSHCLRLELDDGRGFFSMCSSTFRFDTEENFMECERQHLEEEYAAELEDTIYVRQKAPLNPEFTDDEVRECLGDVSYWFDADGVEWGAEYIGGGQGCDTWERFIPSYYEDYEPIELDRDFRLSCEAVEVLWFIEPREYADLLALWRAHHLERGRLFTRIPLWVPQLNTPSIDVAFRNWHRRYSSTYVERYE
jgi:hypothetical protein